jgi:hypothetical protein
MGKRKIRVRKRRERAVRTERGFTVEEYLAGAPVCATCGAPYDGDAPVCGECAAEFYERTLADE